MAVQRLATSTRGKQVLSQELKKYAKLQNSHTDQPNQNETKSSNISVKPTMEEYILYLGNVCFSRYKAGFISDKKKTG